MAEDGSEKSGTLGCGDVRGRVFFLFIFSVEKGGGSLSCFPLSFCPFLLLFFTKARRVSFSFYLLLKVLGKIRRRFARKLSAVFCNKKQTTENGAKKQGILDYGGVQGNLLFLLVFSAEKGGGSLSWFPLSFCPFLLLFFTKAGRVSFSFYLLLKILGKIRRRFARKLSAVFCNRQRTAENGAKKQGTLDCGVCRGICCFCLHFLRGWMGFSPLLSPVVLPFPVFIFTGAGRVFPFFLTAKVVFWKQTEICGELSAVFLQ